MVDEVGVVVPDGQVEPVSRRLVSRSWFPDLNRVLRKLLLAQIILLNGSVMLEFGAIASDQFVLSASDKIARQRSRSTTFVRR